MNQSRPVPRLSSLSRDKRVPCPSRFCFMRRAGFKDLSLSLLNCALRSALRAGLRQRGTNSFSADPAVRFAQPGINPGPGRLPFRANARPGNVQGDVAMLRLYVHDLAPAKLVRLPNSFVALDLPNHKMWG